MYFNDLAHYLQMLEQRSELHRVSTQADPVLEITEIADRIVKSGGPALLFENPVGARFPLAINLFGTQQRTCFALGVENLDAVAARIESMIPAGPLTTFTDKLKLLWGLRDLKNIQPKNARTAPSQQVVDTEPNLHDLPVLQCWPRDAGRFITLPLVLTRHPETGMQNTGMYRMQIVDEKRALMHWHLHHDGAVHHRLWSDRGRDTEVAVALGCDPATIYAATAPLPPGLDEMLFAGFLRNSPVEMVKAKTVDLMVPAHAEFVLEGTVSAGHTMLEGPFGDHTGFYSDADQYPVFTLTAITRKQNPVYPATIVGRPPMEDYYLGKATERFFLPLIRLQLPEIVDINFPAEGVFHNCVLVAICKRYPGHARKVASALWGMGQMMFTKTIVVLDADVNVQDCSQAAWVAFSNVDPERDLFVTKGPLDVLDHCAPTALYGSKVGIDATRKLPAEGHARDWPEPITMDATTRDLVTRRWSEYGFSR